MSSILSSITIDVTTALVNELIDSITKSRKAVETRDADLLENEAKLQEIEHRITEYQARVAQELAIAKRIELAEEVEIEEFYDTTGSGGIGLQTAEGSFNLGVSGNGRRVVKRVYRFKGGTVVQPEQPVEEELK